MRNLICCLLLSLLSSSAQSAETWSRAYVLNGTTPQWIENLTARTGGGYFVSVRSDPGPCIITIERDGAASRSFCVPRDGFGSVLAMPDGGALLYGPLFPIVTGKAAWVVRVDRSGATLWSRKFTAQPYVGFDASTSTRDGGVAFGGSIGPNALLVKMDARGAVQWQRLYEVSGTQAIHAIRQLAGGGFVLAGHMRGNPWLLKVSDSGDIQRQVSLPFDGRARDIQAAGNGFVATGSFGLSSPGAGYWIAKFGADLEPLWQRAASAPSSFGEFTTLSTGGTIVAAGFAFINATSIAQLVAFSATGSVMWQKNFPLADGINRLQVGPAEDGFVFGAIAPPDGRLVIHRIGAAGETDACLTAAVSASTLQFGPMKGVVQYEVVPKAATVVGVDAPLTSSAIQLATGGACKTPSRPKAPQAQVESPAAAAIRKWNETLSKQATEFWMHARTLLMNRKFAELDALASELRRTKAEFGDGYPKLIQFYEALAFEYAPHPEKEHLAALEAWLKAQPRSTAAIVASAMTDLTYAWKARGAGYSNTISEAGEKKFDRLRQAAGTVLRSSEPNAAFDPGYQMVHIQIAGSSCDHVEEIARSKEVRAAANARLLRVAANFLLPRWCGSAEAFRGYAEYAADITKNESGDMLYALVAWDAFAAERDEKAFAEYHFDWKRIRKGFADTIRKYPKVARNYHRLTKMAFFQGDKATVREQLARPELAWLPGAEDVWDTKRQLEYVREWAAK